MRTRTTSFDHPLSGCRGTFAGLLVGLVSLVGACGVEPDVASQEEIESQLRDAFADPELKRDADACIQGSLQSRVCKREAEWKESIARACGAFGGSLGRFAVSNPCDDGGYHQADFRCCPPPPAPPPPPTQCVREAVKTDACHPADQWKEIGARVCSAKLLRLSDVQLQNRCDNVGNYDAAVIVCCRPETPPPPPPDRCSVETLGGDTSCKPEATWKEYGARLCDSKGLQLSDLSFAERCGDGQFRFAKISCCPAAPPPPPMCERAAQGDVTSCKSEATWKEYAARDCNAKGLTLSELAFAERCGDGQYRFAKYACCK